MPPLGARRRCHTRAHLGARSRPKSRTPRPPPRTQAPKASERIRANWLTRRRCAARWSRGACSRALARECL
eukprot:10554662-Alexandrium_andersonii.AAC.1